MLLTDLADVLRAGGLRVAEVPGWKTRGHGDFVAVQSIVCHHTGTADNPTPGTGMSVVIDGRPDLDGPLCNLFLDQAGIWHPVAAGVAWHAGRVINDAYSNFRAIGIEAEAAGTSTAKYDWPPVQMSSYEKGCAVLAKHYRLPVSAVRGHKEVAYPLGRKDDPNFDMALFRAHVNAQMNTSQGMGAVCALGSKGPDVLRIQRLLNAAGASPKLVVDGVYGPATFAAVKAYQTAHHLIVDGICGAQTWRSLLS